ncbi:putative transporter, partial [Lachnellula suecica]
MTIPQLSQTSTDPSLAVHEQVRHHGLEHVKSKQLGWPEEDPNHPRNWSLWTKTFNLTVIISLETFTYAKLSKRTLISATGAEAAEAGGPEYGVGSVVAIFCYTSIYLYGQAIGGLIFSPISESFGRKPLYISSMFLYSGFCIMIGTTPNISGVIIGRFFSGLLSAIPTIVVAGSIEDMFTAEKRVWTIFAWGVAANIGLALGPIYGSYITYHIGWRWVFWIAAIVTFCQAILTLFIRETRPSQILKKRLGRLNANTTAKESFTIDNPDATPSIQTFITESLTRPTKLLFTEPIVFLVTIMGSIAYSQIYLLTVALPSIYTQAPLNFSREKSSLSFIPLAIGFFLDVFPRFYDHFLLKRIKAQGRILKPEHKLRGFAIGAPLLAIGLWWFAWTIPPDVYAPWPVSFAPLILVGFATNEFDATLTGYLTDSYTIFSASAFSSLGFTRAMMSGSVPLFTNQMYSGLGANKATSILASVATAFCAAPVLFLNYGERLRERSSFAKYSREAEKSMGIVAERSG